MRDMGSLKVVCVGGGLGAPTVNPDRVAEALLTLARERATPAIAP